MFGAIRFKEDTTYINDIEGLLKGRVDGKVVGHKVEPLISFEGNFGGEILKVDIIVEENGQQKILHGVAKLIPPTEMQMQVVNTQVTFKNEIAFYETIAPLLQNFQREQGILEVADYFPKFYGGRVSLQEHDVVDTDGIILMENLKMDGYFNVDKEQCFDLNITKQILQVLANFQSTVVALKLKKNDIFHSKIKPHLSEFNLLMDESILKELEFILSENNATRHIIPKVKKLILKRSTKNIREPWATIVHNDLWINNIMVKRIDENNNSIKLIDFQFIDYGSAAADLIVFLFSSVQTSVLRYHFNELLLYYYNEFITNLDKLKTNHKDFTYESFREELRIEAEVYIFRYLSLIMTTVFTPKQIATDVNEISNGSSGASIKENPSQGLTSITFSSECKERIWYVVDELAKQNWI